MDKDEQRKGKSDARSKCADRLQLYLRGENLAILFLQGQTGAKKCLLLFRIILQECRQYFLPSIYSLRCRRTTYLLVGRVPCWRPSHSVLLWEQPRTIECCCLFHWSLSANHSLMTVTSLRRIEGYRVTSNPVRENVGDD